MNAMARQIYFSASIAAGRGDAPIYAQVIAAIESHGRVMTPQFGDQRLGSGGEALPSEVVHDRDLEWIRSADALIAEVTRGSTGVGYQIAKAEEWGKPILCLYRPDEGHLSKMLGGSRKLLCRPYKITPEVPAILNDFFALLDRTEAARAVSGD